jgi:hypothetical protein
MGAAGQGTFQNLDFESANLAGYPAPILGQAATSVPVSDGLPNWSPSFSGTSEGIIQLNQVWYDGLSLGGAAISVVDSKWPGGESPSLTPIQGNYSGSSLFSASGFRLQDAHLQRFGLEFLSCFLVATILPV